VVARGRESKVVEPTLGDALPLLPNNYLCHQASTLLGA